MMWNPVDFGALDFGAIHLSRPVTSDFLKDTCVDGPVEFHSDRWGGLRSHAQPWLADLVPVLPRDPSLAMPCSPVISRA